MIKKNRVNKKDFPMLFKHKDLVYLDSGALVQKPNCVIKAINDFYCNYSISNRTSDSEIGIYIDQKIKQTKAIIGKLIDAKEEEIIFNSGTTDGLNYLSLLFNDLICKDDELIISSYNHSSNMVPWIELAKKTKAKIIFASQNILSYINKKTKLIALSQINNNFNIEVDLDKLYDICKKNNIYLINDAAQAISHQKVSLKKCDAIAFSANKFFGPTGIGVLAIKNNLLKKFSAKKFGGGAVENIKEDGTWKGKLISMHEPGTLNFAGIFGLYEATKYFLSLDLEYEQKRLKKLSNYAYEQLTKIKNLNILSNKGDSIILFGISNISVQDIASYLGHKNIYVRSGYFCAHYLKHLTTPLVRITLHFYNNKNDIDRLINELKKINDGGDLLEFI